MERIKIPERSNPKSVKPVEVLYGMKQLAMIIGDGCQEYLFRPEDGVKLTIDTRVPKKKELYRDVAYTRIDQSLGWNISLPVSPFEFDGEKGVIRPYFRNANNIKLFEINDRLFQKNPNFWTKVAVLDYMCGVIDRTVNDILIVNGQYKVIDSGLSFVDGKEFSVQNAFVRKYLTGNQIDKNIIQDLKALSMRKLEKNTRGLIENKQRLWTMRRKQVLINNGIVV